MLLQKVVFSANDEQDSVLIKIGGLKHRVGYRVGFEIDHYLRLAAKQAARFHRAPANFWRELDLDDLEDQPKPHRGARQSRHRPTYKHWEIRCNPPLVALLFDGRGEEMDYETAVKLGHAIRRAARRAKAWAGDTSKYSAMLGNATDAEEDYKLGLA